MDTHAIRDKAFTDWKQTEHGKFVVENAPADERNIKSMFTAGWNAAMGHRLTDDNSPSGKLFRVEVANMQRKIANTAYRYALSRINKGAETGSDSEE